MQTFDTKVAHQTASPWVMAAGPVGSVPSALAVPADAPPADPLLASLSAGFGLEAGQAVDAGQSDWAYQAPAVGEAVVLAQAAGGLGQSNRGVAPVELKDGPAAEQPAASPARNSGALGGGSDAAKDEDDDQDTPWWLGLGLLALGGGSSSGPTKEIREFISFNYGLPGTEDDDGSVQLQASDRVREIYSGLDEGSPLVFIKANGLDDDGATITDTLTFKLSYYLDADTSQWMAKIEGALKVGGQTYNFTPTPTPVDDGVDFKTFLSSFALAAGDAVTFTVATGVLTLGDFSIQFPSLDNNPVNGNIINAVIFSYAGGDWTYASTGNGVEVAYNPDFIVGRHFFEAGADIASWNSAYEIDGGWAARDPSVPAGYAVLVGADGQDILSNPSAITWGSLDVDGDTSGVQVYVINGEGALGVLTLSSTAYQPDSAFDIGRLFAKNSYNILA